MRARRSLSFRGTWDGHVEHDSPRVAPELKALQLIFRADARHEGADMLKTGIILGSTRPGRNGEAVAKWVYEVASQRGDAEYELVDLAEYNLPHLDEPLPPSLGQYAHEHTKAWARKIASFDGYVFVTPEYNH